MYAMCINLRYKFTYRLLFFFCILLNILYLTGLQNDINTLIPRAIPHRMTVNHPCNGILLTCPLTQIFMCTIQSCCVVTNHNN